ncbi:hypothetical protein EDB19DRAFT_580601 [Suillus lakei]|nr:hypothetical protein EDB19DRAFT_580601 [Suillus lakei]
MVTGSYDKALCLWSGDSSIQVAFEKTWRTGAGVMTMTCIWRPIMWSRLVSTLHTINVELMHRALLVPEILLKIFPHANKILDLSYTRAKKQLSRKSSPVLARTCKTFNDLAMDLLWAELNGIEPMLGCVLRLHPMIYCHDRKFPWSSRDVNPLSDYETHRFLHHAARVRSLRILSNGRFHLLAVIPTETCMFPRLLSLSAARDPTRYLHFFLSPTLRRCVVPVVHPDLKSAVTCCAALEDLSIKAFDESTIDELSLLSDNVRLCTRS